MRRDWKQGGFFGGLVGDGFELRVVMAQGLRDFDFFAGEGVDELKRVDRGFAEVVIVGDDEGVCGGLGNVTDSDGPGIEFLDGIEIVVALGRGRLGIVGEPVIVTAAVEPDVADRGSDAVARLDRMADHGLVDIAEADAARVEKIVEALPGPGGMTDLDDQAIVFEFVENFGETSDVLRGVMERERELKQDGTEAICFLKDVETFASELHVDGSGAFFVGETLPELRREKETGICGDAFEPLGGVCGLERGIEGRVDFDGVEKLG